MIYVSPLEFRLEVGIEDECPGPYTAKGFEVFVEWGLALQLSERAQSGGDFQGSH